MKALLKRLSRLTATSDWCWIFISPLLQRLNALHDLRRYIKSGEESQRARLEQLLGPPVVQGGPFKGMKYPGYRSYGSSIFPKVLGSYERELHPVIEKMFERGYKQIIDVGCAEGYYAIGFALRLPTAKVYAYDVNVKAQEFCRTMAVLNGVDDRMSVKAFCSPEDLRDFAFNEPALIISDCEGFEKHLFTIENLPNLKNADLLVETHDCIDIEISDYLKKLFGATHVVTSIKSVSDIEKARTYQAGPDLPLKDRKCLFGEERSEVMEWLIMERR